MCGHVIGRRVLGSCAWRPLCKMTRGPARPRPPNVAGGGMVAPRGGCPIAPYSGASSRRHFYAMPTSRQSAGNGPVLPIFMERRLPGGIAARARSIDARTQADLWGVIQTPQRYTGTSINDTILDPQ